MFGLPLAFAYPFVLAALILLPVIWYLLRLTPPKPKEEIFPPLVILQKLVKREETPAKSPWWLTLLRLLMASLVILAMAAPIWNPQEKTLSANGNILLIVDNGWASGKNWDRMVETAQQLLNEAGQSDRLIALVQTANPLLMAETLQTPEQIANIFAAKGNIPVKTDLENAARKIREALSKFEIGEIVYLSDGISNGSKSNQMLLALSSGKTPPIILLPNLDETTALSSVINEPGKMTGKIIRPVSNQALPVIITAFDKDNLPISRSNSVFAQGEKSANFDFSEPVELRNQIVRVAIDKAQNAGSVRMLDDSNRRRIVGLISGQSADISQPLLSPLYYINRALAPFSDIRESNTANLDEASNDLINQNVSALVLADVGNLPEEAVERIESWISKGGMLIRFAGPRLAATQDSPLLPVEITEGDRFFGGALSWDTPKSIAPFDQGSPFYGLSAPSNIAITRQILAKPAADLDEKTWARLEDGTPLVTAVKQGAGWIVLFHVNSDNNWSNLPLSGTFVDMLRRVVNLARSNASGELNKEALRLPAFQIMNGKGNLVPPSLEAKPLVIEPGTPVQVTLDHPPGLYGTEDGYVALNLMDESEELFPLDTSPVAGARIQSYLDGQSQLLSPSLLATAALLFFLDCLAMLWFAGILRLKTKKPALVALLLTITFCASFTIAALAPMQAMAQSATEAQKPVQDNFDIASVLKTRFAYVRTGNSALDRTSAAGLLGLTRFISTRTALEPGEPAEVDISTDELSFFPFLYWAIDPSIETPNEETMARVDAYMKEGGTVIFDTRDSFNSSLSGGSSPAILKLREILSSLDIPALEPVPEDHVLTKSFFLLNSFPGRYQGGDLWVEQIGVVEDGASRPARAGDGVSTVMITSNDFAGAWAIDDQNRSLFPTVPSDPQQREYAFRVGVNIAMYTLTGNYKADQVHIPALLERLGQ